MFDYKKVFCRGATVEFLVEKKEIWDELRIPEYYTDNFPNDIAPKHGSVFYNPGTKATVVGHTTDGRHIIVTWVDRGGTQMCLAFPPEKLLFVHNPLQKTPMNPLELLKKLTVREPEKTYMKLGIQDENGDITAGGRDFVMKCLLEDKDGLIYRKAKELLELKEQSEKK